MKNISIKIILAFVCTSLLLQAGTSFAAGVKRQFEHVGISQIKGFTKPQGYVTVKGASVTGKTLTLSNSLDKVYLVSDKHNTANLYLTIWGPKKVDSCTFRLGLDTVSKPQVGPHKLFYGTWIHFKKGKSDGCKCFKFSTGQDGRHFNAFVYNADCNTNIYGD